MGFLNWLAAGSARSNQSHVGANDARGSAHAESPPTSTSTAGKNSHSTSANGKKPRWLRKLLKGLKKALKLLSGRIVKQKKQLSREHRDLAERLSRLEARTSHMGQILAGMAERQQSHHAREATHRKKVGSYREQAKKVLGNLRDRVDGLGDQIDEQAGGAEPDNDEFRRRVLHLLEKTQDSVQDLRPEDRLLLEISNDIYQLDQMICNLGEKAGDYPSGCVASEQLEEVVSTLQGLRTNLVSLLRSNEARLIEEVGDFDARFHEPSPGRRARPGGASGDGEVLRPGLLVEEDGRTRTLRPARVVLYEDVEL